MLKRFVDSKKDTFTEEAIKGKHREFQGKFNYFVTFFAAFVGLYHIYTAAVGPPFAILFRNIHWMMIGVLVFLYFPFSKNSPKNRPQIIDIVSIIATLIIGFYLLINIQDIAGRAGAPTTTDWILGMILTLLVLDAARRTVGWPIVIIATLFLIYSYFGPYMPGVLRHAGQNVDRLFSFLYLTDAGIFGIPLGVSSRFILLFIVFGSYLERAGAGEFFKDLSIALTGNYVGGPGKASILFSGFIGSITGSSTANVVTTGTFTIPLMKKLGYKPAFAGGIEADASTGGQILPPVMGAAAFVMAEYLGVGYVTVMVAAIIPAAFYFITSYYMVHFRALKEGLKPVPKEELPNFWDVIKSGFYYFIPLVLLIFMLVQGFTATRSVLFAIISTIVISWFKKETFMGPYDILLATADGVKKALEVVAACAAAGIIIGVVTMTGLGVSFSTLVEHLAGESLFLGLLYTVIASIILGMGVPTTAKYIILATLVAPALHNLGAPLLAAHLFILYFGTDADITPPVGLAAYAAAGLSGAHPLTTSIEAFKMGITAFIVPFMFIYGEALLMQGDVQWIILAVITGFIACVGLGAAIQGYFVRVMPWWHRIILFIGAVMLMEASLMIDAIGLLLAGFVFAIEFIAKRKEENETAVS
ncbi:TRAP transporter permease [Natranaerofaba carboxydovora]|uniref:TRAP transporter permease n=1 Tax=Natranaerofaba carboxydovora TaxID=2742683 RepID=UPI001F1465C6|nr:TRAP transporter permease [Natranaerofaba carboxydovora]UMZ73611.1 C4-dicarboxylate TRAP transporter large permease protein DctM [Natranaerofaba carboxydovora]